IAVSRLKGRRTAQPAEVSLRADFLCLSEDQFLQNEDPGKLAPAFLPRHFIEDPRQRIMAYRMLGEILTRRELDQLERDWQDQYGPLPPAVENLLCGAALKLAAA